MQCLASGGLIFVDYSGNPWRVPLDAFPHAAAAAAAALLVLHLLVLISVLCFPSLQPLIFHIMPALPPN